MVAMASSFCVLKDARFVEDWSCKFISDCTSVFVAAINSLILHRKDATSSNFWECSPLVVDKDANFAETAAAYSFVSDRNEVRSLNDLLREVTRLSNKSKHEAIDDLFSAMLA
jgi:hypothetical protein